jgi:hypothetical protein
VPIYWPSLMRYLLHQEEGRGSYRVFWPLPPLEDLRMKRYIWSPRSAVYHDRLGLTERSNTDQIKNRQQSDTPPPGRRLCKHCERQLRYKRATLSG